jgi:hypothetical protein
MRMGEDRQPTRSALERAQRKKGPHLSFAAPPTKAIRQGRILTLILLTSQGAFETSVLRKSVCGCFAASVWSKQGEGRQVSLIRERGRMRSREVSTTDRQVAVHDPTPPEVCMREVDDAVVLLPATRRAAERMSATRRCCAEPAGRAAVCRRTTTSQ